MSIENTTTTPATAPPPPTPDSYVTRTYSKSLACVLTDEELIEEGRNLSKAVNDVEHYENELKSMRSQLKAKVDRAQAEVRELTNIVSSGKKYRDVECEEVFDYAAHEVRVVRRDTGEIVESRRMRESEIQRELDFHATHEAEEEETPPIDAEDSRDLGTDADGGEET